MHYAEDEDHEDVIGPKLPTMMTRAEVEEFQRELFAKWDLDQGNIMHSFGLLSYTMRYIIINKYLHHSLCSCEIAP